MRTSGRLHPSSVLGTLITFCRLLRRFGQGRSSCRGPTPPPNRGAGQGLPAPVSVRHGKPKDRRRPRLPADGSGNQCLRRASFGGIIVHSVSFTARDPGELPRRVASASPLHRARWECPARGAIAWRACPFAPGTWPRASPEAAKAHVRCQLTRRSTWTSVRGDGPYGTLPEAPLTLAVTGSFDLPRRRARDSH